MVEHRSETDGLGGVKLPADLKAVHERREHRKLSPGDMIYALEMAIACAISYWIITSGLAPLVSKASDFLGGMWAVVSTVFVFRDSRANSMSAGLERLIATCVSFALCLLYLSLFPFQPLGMAALIGLGTVVMMLLGRREDIVTTGITTAVVNGCRGDQSSGCMATAVAASGRYHRRHRSRYRMYADRFISVSPETGAITLKIRQERKTCRIIQTLE